MTGAIAPRPRVLLTLPDRPWPADGGKRMRQSATLRALADLDVDLDVVVPFAGAPVDDPLPPGVQVRVCRQLHLPPRPKIVSVAVAVARAVPWQIAVLPWQQVRRELGPLLTNEYDLVWFGATGHALSLGRYVRAARTVVDMDDVEVPKLRAFLRLPRDQPGTRGLVRLQRRVELPLWNRAVRRVRRRADVVVVCSELDRTRLGGRGRVAVVHNGYPDPHRSVSRPAPQPPTVLVVGTYYYPPNVDAAVFAVTEVLPRLRELIPDVRLRLVGRGSAELLAHLATEPGVDVVGSVPDTFPELDRSQVCLTPIRYGGGTRIKILEAFAHRLPVVSTALGCEGLDAVAGEHLLVADTASELAQACARVIGDSALAERLAASGHALYASRYRDDSVREEIQHLITHLLAMR